MDRFSVIVTCHNKEQLIARVLESVLRFTTVNYELVIVFDGCTDNSEKNMNLFYKRHKALIDGKKHDEDRPLKFTDDVK